MIEHADGKITVGRNKGGVINDSIQFQLKDFPNCFNGQCAEVNALSRSLDKGRSLEGAKISVSEVWGKANKRGMHGAAKQPCDTCLGLLNNNGVNYYE